MSDPRVDTMAIEHNNGLHTPAETVWSVSPVWQSGAKGKQLVTLDHAGPVADMVRSVIRIFEAKTMAQHREAVEIVEHDLLWDGPPIRLSNKGHLRLAAYLFKYFAHLRIIPVVAVLSQPSPGVTLIELDAVAVSFPNRPWLLPITWLLPDHVAKNVHLKIGVNGTLEAGKVELLMGRLTNWPAFLPFAWQRSFNGVLMGAIPHALENGLGFFFDAADGSDYYARKRSELFRQRHPNSTNPTLDWLTDLATDVPQWAIKEATIGFESAQAIMGGSFERIYGMVSGVIQFYMWLFTTALGLAQRTFEAVTCTVNNAAGAVTQAANNYLPQPGTAGAGSPGYKGGAYTSVGTAGTGYTKGAGYAGAATGTAGDYPSGGAARRMPVATTTGAY